MCERCAAAGFDVAAVVGRDRSRTEARAAAFGVPVAFTSIDEALGLDGIAAVTIATPPNTHCELALRAIEAGKHVLCEKPLARDAAEGREMLAAAEKAGVVHLLGTEFRFDPGQATLARAVRAGMVGEPRLAAFILHVPMLADPSADLPAWWADIDAGGGWIGAHGSQIIDQIRATLGEFEAVRASLVSVAGPTMTADNGFVVHFRMRSGAVGIMQSTASDWGPMLIETRVAGNLGTAWIEGVGARVQLADVSGTHVVPVGDDLPTGRMEPLPEGTIRSAYEQMTAHGLDLVPYTRLAEIFAGLIAGRTTSDDPRAGTFEDGVAAMEVLDAIRLSSRERRWVLTSDG